MKTALLSVTQQQLDTLQPGDTFISAHATATGMLPDAEVFMVITDGTVKDGGKVACVRLENGKIFDFNGGAAVIRVTPTAPVAFKVTELRDV